MNKREVVEFVCKETSLTKTDAIHAIKATVKAIRETIKGDSKISLSGLGTFRGKSRKSRIGRNPKTGETIQIPAGRKISFKPSLSLRKLVKTPKA